MFIRSLTEAEVHAIDEIHSYRTNAHSCLCPHCLQLTLIGGITERHALVHCVEPGCGKPFVAWRKFVPETRSAKLPVLTPPAAK